MSKEYPLNFQPHNAIPSIGWAADHSNTPLKLVNFHRKAPGDYDLVIDIRYCGVCRSDFHIISNEMRNTNFPVIAGHEIIGKVMYVGKYVSKHHLGQFVGVGACYNSCKKCEYCNMGEVQYCEYQVTEVYNCRDRECNDGNNELYGTSDITRGGFSNIMVIHEDFAISLPKVHPDHLAKLSPLLCAGATVWNPLKSLLKKKGRNVKVGIVGIGGLGHIAIKLSDVLGFQTIAFTRTQDKLEDCVKMGAEQSFLSTHLDVIKEENNTFDMILSTIPVSHDLTPWIHLLKVRGILCPIGNMFDTIVNFDLVHRKNIQIQGSFLSSLSDTQECIDFCVENQIYPEIGLVRIQDLNKLHAKLIKSETRYRYVIDMHTIYDNNP